MSLAKRLVLCTCMLMSLDALASERKALEDVDVAALTNETQKMANAEGVHLVWWIPREYWAASAMSEKSMSEDDLDELMKMMENVSMLAVAQGEISAFGSITFYDRDTIVKGMKVEISSGKQRRQLEPMKEVPDSLKLLLK